MFNFPGTNLRRELRLIEEMDPKPSAVAGTFVRLYGLIHHKLRVRGAGLMLRAAARACRGLQSFPLRMSHVGAARVDFREDSAFSLLNYSLGERGSDWSLLSALASLLKPGNVFWDVGANIGYFTQHFAQPRFQLREISAFEPNPVVRKTLESLFESNERVRVHGVALGNENASRLINCVPNASAEGSLIRHVPGAKSFAVEVRRADDFTIENAIESPDVIKIDVEGFEPQVLSGMEKIITQKQPIIFFEHIWLSDAAIRDCQPPGYDLVFLLDDGTLTRDFGVRLRGANAILIPRSKVTSLPASVSYEGAQ